MGTSKQISRNERLAAIREAHNLTQAEFAKKLGFSLRAIQNYEHGERELSVQLFQALHDVFQIDPLWLLCGSGLKPTFLKDRAHIDVVLMEKIVNLIEEHLGNRRATLAADKKARLIRLVYEYCNERPQEVVNGSFVSDLMAYAT